MWMHKGRIPNKAAHCSVSVYKQIGSGVPEVCWTEGILVRLGLVRLHPFCGHGNNPALQNPAQQCEVQNN